jgi:hypothetical protein
MQLPWNDYQSDLSIQDALESALNGEDGGSQLASSKSFTDDFELEGLDLWSVESRYKQFFADTAVEISAALGQSTFSGAMPAAMEWMDKLEVWTMTPFSCGSGPRHMPTSICATTGATRICRSLFCWENAAQTLSTARLPKTKTLVGHNLTLANDGCAAARWSPARARRVLPIRRFGWAATGRMLWHRSRCGASRSIGSARRDSGDPPACRQR